MALIEVNFLSECLMRTVTVQAVIPFDKLPAQGATLPDAEKYPVLYLLHGIFGNYTDWVSGTCIQRWAEERNLAVIMPSGENHFYTDCEANGERFSEFIGRELPEKMRRLFPLSEKKEETFIGGLSMGGYGALLNGLTYYETFGYITGLSSGLFFDESENSSAFMPEQLFGPDFRKTIFGEPYTGGKNDLRALAKKRAAGVPQKELPKIYLCCGLSDSLLDANREFSAYLKELGYSVIYEEGPGDHEWDFWNTYIKRILDVLPLENAGAGINSGNVGI